MSTLRKIKIEGLKSIVDSKSVELKDFNILVGTNSSGKSTFLRTFPLIRQSVERRTRGPILWNGYYTDFESFDNSVNSEFTAHDKDEEIKFSFAFDINYGSYSPYDKTVLPVAASIFIRPGKKRFTSYTQTYAVTVDAHRIMMTFNEDGVLQRIESPRISWELIKHNIKYQQAETDSLLPYFNVNRGVTNKWYQGNQGNDISTSLFDQLVDRVKTFSGSTSDSRSRILARKVLRIRGTLRSRLTKIKKINQTKKWSKLVQSWSITNSDFKFLMAHCDLLFIVDNSMLINSTLGSIYKGVRYIAPLRTSTERYYRFQDLSIDELDHQGENLAMFLTAIPKRYREDLNTWTMTNFNFLINEKYAGSNVSVELSYGNENISDNITDMGFGFSQILPIIVNLWSVSSGYENSKKKSIDRLTSVIFAIEQPELHLHPKMQADLTVIFQKALELAKTNSIELKFIIETHSQSLLAKFGDLVATEVIGEGDVNVLLFNQDRVKRETSISYSTYDSDGILKEWPSDFFYY